MSVLWGLVGRSLGSNMKINESHIIRDDISRHRIFSHTVGDDLG